MHSLIYPFTTMSFAYPWVLAAPAVLLFLLMVQKPKKPAVLCGSSVFLSELPKSLRSRLRALVLPFLATVFVVFLCVAAARPQRVRTLSENYEARNIMLTLDISPSMERRDFPSDFFDVTRLDAVKRVVADFVSARARDRLGVVIFAGQAVLLSPLTIDHQLVRYLVQRIQPRIAGQGTAIGDGLGLSLKRMEDVAQGSKAIVLLTDGVNNMGQVNPLKAAKVAHDLGVKVHTIGVGPLDAPPSDFDEATLKEIARTTGGKYFRASDLKQLTDVYDQIDQLEQTLEEKTERLVADELFVPFALVSLAAFVLYQVLSLTVFLRIP